MEAGKFRQSQEPLRARYREEPGSAFLTLVARGRPGADTVTCKVETGRGAALAGIHPKAGGTGEELCSGDMLLEALVACAGVSLSAAATMLEIPLGETTVIAEGDVDLRGTLGVSEEVPVGFKEIRLKIEVAGPMSQQDQEALLELVERYCVVFNTLQKSPKTDIRLSAQPFRRRA